uniref:Uncharacterized protein n=1 Tax=Toxoplasma gondii COUG TaxID=1074873 RepID=A0A2G8Y9L7_TOXGO|nr:hypothetical protein TGCOUG_391820 [Toxoplasma gondii COUG]
MAPRATTGDSGIADRKGTSVSALEDEDKNQRAVENRTWRGEKWTSSPASLLSVQARSEASKNAAPTGPLELSEPPRDLETSEDESPSSEDEHEHENADPFDLDEDKEEEREARLYDWVRESARLFTGDLGGDVAWPQRRFACSFWRDKVVGVGGPLHLAGALKLWDAATGFLDSCSISAGSQELVRSIASDQRGGPLVLSAGQRRGGAALTFWGYFAVDQLANFHMI